MDDVWTIQEVVRATGVTSRTLRHYQQVGLLEPAFVGDNGVRHYDRDALVRLQRILVLRGLWLGLDAIGRVLAEQTEVVAALEAHAAALGRERQRLGRQIASITETIERLRNGDDMTIDNMFDGFDHTQYREEVEERWGADAYRRSAEWWESKTDEDRAEFHRLVTDLNQRWIALAEAGADPHADEAQAVAADHLAWLRGIPGIPSDFPTYVRNLAEGYVTDERFAANYGGREGAAFVRDALIGAIAD